MNVVDNGNGTCNVDVTKEQFAMILAGYAEQTEDLKAIKNIIYTLLAKIGFIDEKGEMRETINMKMIMGVATKAMTANKQFKEDMAFLAEALPLIEKYKNL